jgi:hypothetical protein
MNTLLSFYCYLLLSFLAILVPLFSILLSIFRAGVLKLGAQYQNEIASSRMSLQEQTAKSDKPGEVDIPAIKKIIKELEKAKKRSENKLSLLNPQKQTLSLFVLFMSALLAVIPTALIKTPIYLRLLPFLGSLILFSLAMYKSWKLIGIIVEIRTNVDDNQQRTETTMIELLTIISKQRQSEFLREIHLSISGNPIKDDDAILNLMVNVPKELEVSFVNNEKRMASRVEVGFVFPRDIMIGKTGSISIYTAQNGTQYIRYNLDVVHAHTEWILSKLKVTAINPGDFKIKTWIRAENIEDTQRIVLFKVLS